jgi:hypothetical protein
MDKITRRKFISMLALGTIAGVTTALPNMQEKPKPESISMEFKITAIPKKA